MNGRDFDVQVVRTPPSSPRGKIMENYVLARIQSMHGIDIGLYDYDRHNALYYFAVNADEQIYFRYGGRDSESQDTYLDLDSLALALETGLEQHEQWNAGKFEAKPRPEPLFPRDIPGVDEFIIQKGRCVECHHLAHFTSMELERAGQLDKLRDMYRSPDIKTLGLILDVPKGLVLAETTGEAQKAGILPGDMIRSIEGEPVITYGDFQYFFDQVDRRAPAFSVTVERTGQEIEKQISLPKEWWAYDLSHRYWTIEPLIFFDVEPLTLEEKEALELPTAGFASRVTEIPFDAKLEFAHELKVGDIVTAVAGVTQNDLVDDVVLHIKLAHKSGETIPLTIIRDGEIMEMPLYSVRKIFRQRED
ncbi:MAG: Trx7/PDZ domain-containing (seleno)protein [Verrucomicrobiota bacterium]